MKATTYTTKNELRLSNAQRKARLAGCARWSAGGGLNVRQAQQLIAEDWPMAYERLVVRAGA